MNNKYKAWNESYLIRIKIIVFIYFYFLILNIFLNVDF